MSPDRWWADFGPEVSDSLDRRGFWSGWRATTESAARDLVDLARRLGDIYVPEDCDPDLPVIATEPTQDPDAPPFDRPDPIGWHGDFASHANRPVLSLVWVTREDPAGPIAGAWRLASVSGVRRLLARSTEGRAALDRLARTRVSFSYGHGAPSRPFRVVEQLGPGDIGLRFYKPSILSGCRAATGVIDAQLARALDLLEEAADETGIEIPVRTGSLLIADNWRALHDRTAQTVAPAGSGREALLAFVSTRHDCGRAD